MGTNAINASLRKQLAATQARIAELERMLASAHEELDELEQAKEAALRMADVCRSAADLTGYFDDCAWSPEVKLAAGFYPKGTTLIPVREDLYIEIGVGVGKLLDLLDPDGSIRAEMTAQSRNRRELPKSSQRAASMTTSPA